MNRFIFQHCSGPRSPQRSAARSFKTRSLRAFTLIELMLVVIIIGIMLGVAMPSLVETMRRHRLRTAARTLVTVARYARSMAILKQSDLSISFNLDTGQVDLVAVDTSLPRFTRILEGIALEYVEVEGTDCVTKEVCTIPYRRNGTCRPFSVKIRDRNGNYALIKVDALSSVTTREFGR